MNASRFLTGLPALTFLLALAACGGGGAGQPPPGPATASTLAYVATECRGDADGGTIRQSLQIRQGEQAPITVVEHAAVLSANAGPLCAIAGVPRQGTRFSRYGVFHRLGVSPDGSQVVFEVTDDDVQTLFPANALPPEQEGIFAVGADGTGLRRLGAASREPPYENFGLPGLLLFTTPFFVFSPNGGTIAYTDRGPSRDNQDATQIFTLDLATRKPFPVTHLPPATLGTFSCGNTNCPVFNDDETITFHTSANADGMHPDGKASSSPSRPMARG